MGIEGGSACPQVCLSGYRQAELRRIIVRLGTFVVESNLDIHSLLESCGMSLIQKEFFTVYTIILQVR
jgi:hypothetical protein